MPVVMDRVATWWEILSGVQSALGGCMTSDSGAKNVFGERVMMTVARMEMVLEELPSAFSCSFGEEHVSRS